MPFQEILDNLIERVPEATAVTFNAICARTIEVPNDALQLLGAYRNVVEKHLQQAIEEFDQDAVEQVTFCTGQHWVLMMSARERCALVMVMRREGILGRARFEMMRAIERLNSEL